MSNENRPPGRAFTYDIGGSTATAEGFDEEREDRGRQAYGAEKYDRLRALKRKYVSA